MPLTFDRPKLARRQHALEHVAQVNPLSEPACGFAAPDLLKAIFGGSGPFGGFRDTRASSAIFASVAAMRTL